MKLAEVTYRGQMQSKNVRGPSGEQYHLVNPMGGSPRPVPVEKKADIQFFERNEPTFGVEWTSMGKLMAKISGPVDSILDELGYQEKKKVAKEFDVETEESHPTQEELNEALEPVVEDLRRQMEN